MRQVEWISCPGLPHHSHASLVTRLCVDGNDEKRATTKTITPSNDLFSIISPQISFSSLPTDALNDLEQSKPMDSLSLTYPDVRGLAEPINLMLVDANINYRSERLPLSQWNIRKAEGTYGPVYGQPFHDLPTLTVKTTIGTVVLAGIYTIMEYLEDAFDIHAGKDILFKAKINMIRDASMSFLQEFHNYLNSETWDCSEERASFRQLHILPFLLDLSRHIGVNGVRSEFGADPNRPLTAAGACVFEALDIIELFFPAALNDWPVLAILRGHISIRPNIQKYIQGGKRQQKVSLSRHETPERVAYLSLKDTQPRKSDVLRAPSMHSTSETVVMSISSMPGSSPKNTLKKKRQPSPFSNATPPRRSTGSRMESEESESHHRTPSCSSFKSEDVSRKHSIDSSAEGKRHRSHSFTNLFVKKRSSKTKLQTQSSDSAKADDPKDQSSSKPLNGYGRGRPNTQRAGSGGESLHVQSSTLNPPFLPAIPKTLSAFPLSGDDVRSSLHSDSIYSSASGPEYNVTVLAI